MRLFQGLNFVLGITSGDLVDGIKFENNSLTAETFITHKSSDFKKILKSNHKIR